MQVLLRETHSMTGENLDKSFLSNLKHLCPGPSEIVQVDTQLSFYSGSSQTPLSSRYRVKQLCRAS